jgi:putative hemolysin
MTIFIIACVTAVAVSFLCSLLEAILLSLDDIHLETKTREGRLYAKTWQKMKQSIDRPIAAILILNTVAHTGGATVAGSTFDEIWGDEWIWVFSIVFTLVILFGTEIIPKVIGVSHAQRLAPWLAPVLGFMTTALRPAIAVTERIARPFKRDKEKQRLSIADLRTMAGMARSARLIEAEQENIIINAVKLRQMTVAAVMVPRERIAFFDARQTNIVNFETAASSLHTRYPVTSDGTVDGIVGYANFKEIVAIAPSRREVQIQPFIRPLSRIRATATLNEALQTLLGRREHIALVEDEQHCIVGLVTLEDVLEEIVGDLTDEFDFVTGELLQVADRRWKIGGGASMAEVARNIGMSVPTEALQFSLSDWLKNRTGNEPKAGQVVTEGRFTFTVLQTRRRLVHRVLVEAGQ